VRPIASSLFIVCLSACAATPAESDPDALSLSLVEPGSPEAHGIVAFVNDPETTESLLDDDVGLDARAARGLVEGRPFADLEAIDAVPYVGRVALEKLLAWAESEGYVDAGGEARERAILGLVNHPDTTESLLDVDVGLDRRAATNIIAARPFANLAALDAVSYVGPTALDALAAYGLAHGYDEGPGEEPLPCAIISEYVEGQGINNKGFEITNCGGAPLDLASVGVCLVQNGDTTCGPTTSAGDTPLAAGDAWVLCRTKGGTFNDPMTSLSAACDREVGTVAYFSGDDRLIVFHDADRDQRLGASETILDTFGDPAARPTTAIWADVGYRRCDLAPRVGGAFDAESIFTTHARHDHTHLGVPPTSGCGTSHGAPGDDCVDTAACEPGLRCYGPPSDGSFGFGKCVDPTPVPGEGDDCYQTAPCAEGLICAGWTLWGEGTCNPQWMAGRYRVEGPAPIFDLPSVGIAPSVVVYGLASVPVDIEVVLELDHPRPTDLRVTLVDPNGDEAVLWDRSPELSRWSRSFVPTGISRDDQVNGRWHLRIVDVVSGQSGTFRSFSLFVVSRWD
jgi:DNA uptake protein ComE-like DNA-binding protein